MITKAIHGDVPYGASFFVEPDYFKRNFKNFTRSEIKPEFTLIRE